MVVSELKHKERSRTLKHCVSAAFESNADHSKKLWVSLSKQLNAFYLFTRPHTILGTIVGITSISLLPLESVSDLSLTFIIGLIKALVPALLMNIYVVGLNQIFDVEIDKDIPDVDGDRDFGIQSFSVRLGQERVFWLCIKLLMTAYMAAMFVGVSSSNIYQKFITVIGHGILAYVLWFNACSLDLKKKTAITSFYMFIWKERSVS
ncbi:hypothetical protein J5N97_007888 [Dioscorea zingiberensis]|uniref:Uncharacterized protein n=1 Tax=Dioscorea zingiberensis TaxID=325984 RepID=A0A9D5DGD3_9LILI|nr:hypothetical protein J5N97_007888 [Dioscorea zingiberensis]